MSVAPVFLLAGIGGLLVVLNSRLVRIIDRSRELQALTQSRDTPVSSERESKTELQALKRRMALVMKAIELLTITILLVALVVAFVFISVVTQLDLALLVVPLFVMAMVCLMAAALLFQREVQLATTQVRRCF
ncbi:possible HAMP domain [Prochlorococcus marinus str. MIT 9313]|uniref:Possible HAMP domain n=1 Tax=Prochlorococcus marinus (strain MIT 9313) TaxID=74547 RepID=Q7V7A2_PROMM|nr:possible HAMP domain [Prochlorococcus marinus str. MIT 9313]